MHPAGKLDDGVSISLVIPAWNECESIVRAIEEADSALREITSDYEIIVVDDGSTDDTALLVNEASLNYAAVRLVQHCPNQGYGASLRSGFKAAQKELVAFTDADCQFDLTELDRFVFLADRYDIVCGYRIDRKDTALRCLYSKLYNQLVRILLRTDVRDVDCALKLFHRNQVQKLTISGDGFLVNSELLTQAKQSGLRVVEVGVSHRPRVDGLSTVSIAHIPRVLSSLIRFWWNSVQFPAPASSSIRGTAMEVDAQNGTWFTDQWAGRMQWALLVIAAVFMLTNLDYPLIDRDETRYAEIPREMLTTGNWILPQLNFQTYYDKPPLLYWLCACSFTLFGVNETAARLVPAFSALLTIAGTMWYGSRTFGARTGLLSGGVLLLSVGFAFTSRYLLLDGVLSMFVSLSLFTAHQAIRQGKIKWSWWILSGICCGLAFLTKGPLAVVLWLPPVFAFAWLTESSAKPRAVHYVIFGSVVAMIAGPWLFAVHMQDATFLKEFFYKHNLRRFAGEFHDRPFWYFIPVLLIGGHPWSFLTIPFARFLFGQKGETRFKRPSELGFLLLSSVWCFAFFSISRCKLPTYLLPAAPAMALMMGYYLNQILQDWRVLEGHWFARYWSARAATTTTCFAGVGSVVFVIASGFDLSFSVYVWAMIWTILWVSSLTLLRDRHHAQYAWASSAGVAFLLLVMVMQETIPEYSRSQTLFGASSPLADQIKAKNSIAVATISHEFSEVPFYLGRSDIRNFASISDAQIGRYVKAHDRMILVLEKRISDAQLFKQLPLGTVIQSDVQRGPARIVEVRSTSAEHQTARNEDGTVIK